MIRDPFATVAEFHGMLYGELESVPTVAPSTKNSTRLIPPASLASAASVVVPVTVAPFAGAVTDTVGGVVSVAPGGRGRCRCRCR